MPDARTALCQIQPVLTAHGACACGAVSLDALAGKLRGRAPDFARSLICAAFPYYAGDRPGNIALYARGEDYHRALGRRLEAACAALRGLYPRHGFAPYVDTSPFPEVYAAACAGVGVIGRHGLLITKTHGSFVFIGIIATDLALEGGRPAVCRGCGACERACPQNALGTGGDRRPCLSALTQERRALSESEARAVARGGMVWGCDICQRVCPHNENAALSALPEFSRDLICRLAPGDVRMGERAFRRAFAHRAFGWRGVRPLRRNMDLLAER